ncbi:hypothetical protein AHAS_Ahas07G0112700 [Arachis hypogaea]
METEVRQINCLSQEKILQHLPRQVNIIERKIRQINYLNQEVTHKRIEEQLQTPEIQDKIKAIEEKIKTELYSLNPTTFQHRKLHEISLPYEDGFNKRAIENYMKYLYIENLSRNYNKFPNEITDKKQLQRFLGCLNYVAKFLPGIRITCEPLYKRLRKNPPPWTKEMTSIIIKIKNAIQEIPCISILDPLAKLIVKTDASELGYGGILKQIPPNSSKEQIVKYHSGI